MKASRPNCTHDEAVIEMLKESCSVEAEPKFEGGNVVAKLDTKKVAKKESKKEANNESTESDPKVS